MNHLTELSEELAEKYDVKEPKMFGFLLGGMAREWDEETAREKAREHFGE